LCNRLIPYAGGLAIDAKASLVPRNCRGQGQIDLSVGFRRRGKRERRRRRHAQELAILQISITGREHDASLTLNISGFDDPLEAMT